MERHQPPRRLTDEELIDLHIAEYAYDPESTEFETIGHAAARMIASQYHDGQQSALYMFASTGRCDGATTNEAVRALEAVDDEAQYTRVIQLFYYFIKRRDEHSDDVAIDGWHKLWLRQPGEQL